MNNMIDIFRIYLLDCLELELSTEATLLLSVILLRR